ncbi:30S ribosomal protein S11, chloroplastic, partial [Cucurbita argyrosperma subsp. argyrosperma]
MKEPTPSTVSLRLVRLPSSVEELIDSPELLKERRNFEFGLSIAELTLDEEYDLAVAAASVVFLARWVLNHPIHSWSSTGTCGFKGPRTLFAAQTATGNAIRAKAYQEIPTWKKQAQRKKKTWGGDWFGSEIEIE